jgi:outer membrane protein assembly factor BamD
MEIGRFYSRQRNYIAAINRFRNVIRDYQTTSHVPEALYRLTEVYLALGLTSEAKRNAAVLGYNYPGSEWYQSSWDVLHKSGLTPE